MGRHIDRYVIVMILTPFFTIQAIAVALLVLEQMLRLVDFVVEESGPFALIWRMLAFLIPEYVTIAAPVGLMLSIVLAVRKLSLNHEWQALLATGYSPTRILRPLYAVAGPLAVLSLGVAGFLQPLANYEFSALKNDIRSGAFTRAFKVGEFLPIGERATMRIGALDAEEGMVRDIFLERCTTEGACTATTAREGLLLSSEDGRRVALRLNDGREINFEVNPDKPGLITFEEQQVVANLPALRPFRDRGARPEETTIAELFAIMKREGPATFEDYDLYRADLHWRLIMAGFFLAIPFLALPLGAADPRRDSGAGAPLGVISVILFIETLETARALSAEPGGVHPGLIMWPVLAIFTASSALLFAPMATRSGGRPLEPLENLAADLRGALKRLFARKPRAKRAA